MCDADRQFYALIEVEEWGEKPREQRVGPFSAPDEETLRERLEERGDRVILVEWAS